MSIGRVKPGGWAFGDKLSSPEINELDTNVARALDKAGSDQLSGVTTLAANARIYLNAANAAITASDGGFISASTDGAIRSETPGVIQLGGGATDWPRFTNSTGTATAVRSRTVMIHPRPLDLNGWSYQSQGYLQGVGNSVDVLIPLPVHQGATLESVAVYMRPSPSHASLPTTWPSVDVMRQSFDAPGTIDSLMGGWSYHPAETLGDWNDGTVKYSLHSCVANHTNLAPYANTFTLALRDEFGGGAILGNHYLGIELVFRNIADMRFP